MTELSPAAQAVAKAALYVSSCDPEEYPYQAQEIAAAVLRAAADQVVPKFWHEDNDIYGETMQDVRQNLLAIATELEAQ